MAVRERVQLADLGPGGSTATTARGESAGDAKGVHAELVGEGLEFARVNLLHGADARRVRARVDAHRRCAVLELGESVHPAVTAVKKSGANRALVAARGFDGAVGRSQTGPR